MIAATVSQTTALIIAVTGLIAAIGSTIAAVLGAVNRRSLQTPSGDRIGAVAERTHDLAAVSVAAVTGTNGPEVNKAMAKLNADPKAPVDLPPGTLDHKA